MRPSDQHFKCFTNGLQNIRSCHTELKAFCFKGIMKLLIDTGISMSSIIIIRVCYFSCKARCRFWVLFYCLFLVHVYQRKCKIQQTQYVRYVDNNSEDFGSKKIQRKLIMRKGTQTSLFVLWGHISVKTKGYFQLPSPPPPPHQTPCCIMSIIFSKSLIINKVIIQPRHANLVTCM